LTATFSKFLKERRYKFYERELRGERKRGPTPNTHFEDKEDEKVVVASQILKKISPKNIATH
jgi:hypothetical protein